MGHLEVNSAANINSLSVQEIKAYVTLYTDGSATERTTAGAAAMVAIVGPADPVITHASTIRAAELTSSFKEEKSAWLRLGKGQLPH